MKTLNYFSDKIRFLKNLKTTKTEDEVTSLELSHPLYEESFEEIHTEERCTNTLLSQMYSEENEALFI